MITTAVSAVIRRAVNMGLFITPRMTGALPTHSAMPLTAPPMLNPDMLYRRAQKNGAKA